LSGCIFATKACIDNQKKRVKQQYLLYVSSQCSELRPLAAEIGLPVCGTPANFNGFRVLPSLLQQRRSSEANQTLLDVWPSPGLVHYIYIFGGSCPLTEFLPGAKLTLRASLAFSYIGSVTERHSSSGCQPNFAAWYNTYKEWNYGTFTYMWLGGHHVGHRPTF